MCMFASEATVSKTNIFVGYNEKKQVTVYKNSIGTEVNNAMIIPVFGGNIEFLDMTGYKNFFDDCKNSFPVIKSARLGFRSRNATFSDSESLEVFSVGSYNVSVAKSVDDIIRANADYFTVDSKLIETLRSSYKSDQWSFIIFAIKPGNSEYEPFAWTSPRIGTKLFIPTRHYHGSGQNEYVADDWGHNIYIAGANAYKWPVTAKEVSTKKCLVDKKKLGFDFMNSYIFKKYTIKGPNTNCDLIAEI